MTVGVRDGIGALAGREPLFVAPDAALQEVVHILWRESIGVLVVGDTRHPVGVLSERDVIAFLAQGGQLEGATAADVMTRHVVSLREDDRVFDAAAQMLDDGIRHLPVVDDHDEVIGIVSIRDVIRPLLISSLGG